MLEMTNTDSTSHLLPAAFAPLPRHRHKICPFAPKQQCLDLSADTVWISGQPPHLHTVSMQPSDLSRVPLHPPPTFPHTHWEICPSSAAQQCTQPTHKHCWLLWPGLTPAGVLHSWFLGTTVYSAFGPAGYLLVCLYFILGSLVSGCMIACAGAGRWGVGSGSMEYVCEGGGRQGGKGRYVCLDVCMGEGKASMHACVQVQMHVYRRLCLTRAHLLFRGAGTRRSVPVC